MRTCGRRKDMARPDIAAKLKSVGSDVARVLHHDGSGYLMVTIIRGECQLYLAKNPEKIGSHDRGQEMSERWTVLQQKGTDV
ncbi:hypothetical protein PoB_004073700 [Plakobranchus ocellatus]|uniref:Uncharacterized protein n=1 Tax=Plakobranchus ocellatus TaxID=259542 RepID=A0AAV4B4V0_9GAST|nr:hypothetical protein PoB_004073700 [Plakobranchus ocellatus]